MCAEGRLEDYVKDQAPPEMEGSIFAQEPVEEPLPIEDRLSRLMRQQAQRHQYQEQLAATMAAWSNPTGEEQPFDDEDA